MFYHCNNLREVIIPEDDFVNVIDMSEMFSACEVLEVIPPLNLASVTTMNYTFAFSHNIKTIPDFVTPNLINLANAFQDCHTLTTAPILDTASVTSMWLMFSNCYSLKTIPQYDYSSVMTMSATFQNCYSLETLGVINSSVCTNFFSTFNTTTLLKSITSIDTSSATDIRNIFYNSGITNPPSINLSGLVDNSGAGTIIHGSEVHELMITGSPTYSINLGNGQLNASAIDAVFTALGTAAPGGTVTVINNSGATTCTPSIATNKGWTVAT
jgi:hypothetical protein